MPEDASDATAVLEAENIHFSYPVLLSGKRTPIFNRVDIRVCPGEITGLFGPSGIGKSTLGNILLGLCPPDQGRVLWAGKPVYRKKKFVQHKMRRFYQKIYQDPGASFPPGQPLFRALADALAFHEQKKGDKPTLAWIKSRILASLPDLNLEPGMLDRFPHQLSGGELQRMALARVMLVSPRFIMADEPTSRLDLAVQARILHLMTELSRSRGVGILLVSHDLSLLRAVCQKIFHLIPGDGRVSGASINALAK